jgi:hypothetical protein
MKKLWEKLVIKAKLLLNTKEQIIVKIKLNEIVKQINGLYRQSKEQKKRTDLKERLFIVDTAIKYISDLDNLRDLMTKMKVEYENELMVQKGVNVKKSLLSYLDNVIRVKDYLYNCKDREIENIGTLYDDLANILGSLRMAIESMLCNVDDIILLINKAIDQSKNKVSINDIIPVISKIELHPIFTEIRDIVSKDTGLLMSNVGTCMQIIGFIDNAKTMDIEDII